MITEELTHKYDPKRLTLASYVSTNTAVERHRDDRLARATNSARGPTLTEAKARPGDARARAHTMTRALRSPTVPFSATSAFHQLTATQLFTKPTYVLKLGIDLSTKTQPASKCSFLRIIITAH